MLLERQSRGDCLITVATGPIDATEQERTGLVECHAYAVLEMQHVDVRAKFTRTITFKKNS